MIGRTEALCLRFHPVSDTSRVVLWLSREAGKLATLVKGAQRPRSLFLGQYDLFYTCELLYYPRPHDQLHLAKECSPLAIRSALRSDWKAASLASYACSVMNRLIPPDSPHPELYDLLETVLDDAAAHGATPASAAWFELKLLDRLGLRPRLSHCVGCGAPFSIGGPARFSSTRGGLMCSRCDANPSDTPIPPDVLSMLASWQRSASPRVLHTTKVRRAQELTMTDLLGAFLAHHLELGPGPRLAALDALARNPGLAA